MRSHAAVGGQKINAHHCALSFASRTDMEASGTKSLATGTVAQVVRKAYSLNYIASDANCDDVSDPRYVFARKPVVAGGTLHQ
jgi:hypothetical protein